MNEELPSPPDGWTDELRAQWIAGRDRVFGRPTVMFDFGQGSHGWMTLSRFTRGTEAPAVLLAEGKVQIPPGYFVAATLDEQALAALAEAPAHLFAELHVRGGGDDAAKIIGAGDLAEVVSLFPADGQASTLTDAGLASLAVASSLSIASVRGGFSDVGLAALARAPKLRSVTATSDQITDAGLVALAGAPELIRVAVTSAAITDAGLAALARAPKLYGLTATSDLITGSGLAGLGEATKDVVLAGARVRCASLPDLPHLTYLTLTGPLVLDGVADGVGAFPALQRLNLRMAEGVEPSFEELLAVRRALPNLVINGMQMSEKALARYLANR